VMSFTWFGCLVVGRFFGWRVVRLTVSRRMWMLVSRSFGDPKEWMPERGPLARKSLGLKVVDKLGDYWDFINGAISRDGLSERDRKTIT
ncbi:MAG: hypothetical protein V9E84_00065, partial [Trichococcus flocculiformis]